MPDGTDVQRFGASALGMRTSPMPDEDDELLTAEALDPSNAVTMRLSLDMPVDDLDFLDKFAAYSNALDALHAKARGGQGPRGKTKRRLWARKGLAQRLLSLRIARLRLQMQFVMSQLGPIPPPPNKDDDPKKQKAAMARLTEYAEQALALINKR